MAEDPGTPEEPRDDVPVIAAWLRERPPGYVITWSEDGRRLLPDVRPASWMDIQVPAMEQDIAMNWIWTIQRPDDDPDQCWPATDSSTLTVALDGSAHVCRDPGTRWWDEDGPVFTSALGSPATGEQERILAARAAELGGPDGPSDVIDLEYWTNASVEAALLAWIAQYAGRTDLTLAFDPGAQSPMLVAAIARASEYSAQHAAAVQDGTDLPGHDLGAACGRPRKEWRPWSP